MKFFSVSLRYHKSQQYQQQMKYLWRKEGRQGEAEESQFYKPINLHTGNKQFNKICEQKKKFNCAMNF
jgi:hypothetical protein